MTSYNAPNQPALTYRLGTHPTFLHRMRDRLASQTLPPTGASARPLAALTTRDSDDPAMALLDAWSMVGDVLTFYTERIANEGFLRTATELRSVVALANKIGYQLQPGVAATTSLAFTVEAADASGIVTLPPGIQVQSIPGPGQVPQLFETIEEISARPEWNALSPDQSPERITQTIDDSTTELRLAGSSTGLQPGDKLLMISQHSGKNKWYVVTLQTVEPNTADDYTTVRWDKALANNPNCGMFEDMINFLSFPPQLPPLLSQAQLFAFRQQGTLFGVDAPRWEDMPDEVKREASGVQSGLYQNDGNSTWTPIEFTEPHLEFQAFAAHTRGETHYLFAGTATDGVFRSTDGGVTWTACNTGLSNLTVNALCSDDRGYLFAGTTNGTIFFSTDDGDNWTQLSIGSPAAIFLEENTGGNIDIGGTKYDILDIQVVQNGLPNTAIRALLSYNHDNGTSTRYLVVGTDNGLYRSANNGTTWVPVNGEFLANQTIHALSYYDNSGTITLFAATNDKVYQSDGETISWLETVNGISDIRALLVQGTNLFAGTYDGLFKADNIDNITSWNPVDADDPKEIRALALSNGNLLAVTPSANAIANEWPGFTLRGQRLDLDTVYENLLANSWALLLNGEDVRPYLVTGVTTEQGDDFTLHQKITRLALSSDEELASFGGANLRATEVLLQSERLPLFEEMRPTAEPLKGDEIELDSWVTPLQPGQPVVVSGKRIRVKMSQAGDLVAADGSTKELAEGDLLIVCSPPKAVGDNTEWTLKEQSGFIGVLTIAAGNEQPVYELAAESDEVVSELHFVKGMEGDSSQSIIVLHEPLKNSYDANTVTIQANVALATHGESVFDEVLGSGDGTKINQRFRLQKPPLTYVAAPTERGVESTLTVRVNGIEWEEVPSFNEQGERSQCYIVRQDSAGQTDIIFGDGQKGARLPSGQENVVATYRTGIGLAGEVDAHTLVLLQTSPLGVLEVTNPLPASGAADAQSLAETRDNAPLAVLTMDRVVSLSDYEDFARSFAGIGKVEGAYLWTDQGPLIQLTIADTDGDAVEKGSALYANLLAAINQRRNRLQQIQIDSYEPLFFRMAANLFYDSRYEAEAVEDAVRHVLLDTFSFQKRSFAQDVAASEVIAVVQAVEGIIAVDLNGLDFTTPETSPQEDSSGVELKNLLSAEPAFWDQGEGEGMVRPAQLLLIESSDETSIGLILEES